MKILVIRLSSIGDIVLTTPVLRCVKRQRPEIEIHYLVKPQFKEVLSENPYIDQLHFYDDNRAALIRDLKQISFDKIIDLHHNLRTWKLKKKLGIPSASFNKLNFQKWWYVRTKKDVLPEKHIVDRYLEAVAALNVQNDNLGLEFYIHPENHIDLWKTFQTDVVAAVAIGAQYKTKCAPAEKLAEVIRQIEIPVVLLGGKTDQATAQEIIALCPDRLIFDKTGAWNIQQSASVVEQAKVLLTHDTGLMHIASAFQTPIVTIWGNTTPKLGMYAYKPDAPEKVINHEVAVSCRPCSKIGYQKCPKGHFKCMQLQNTQSIAQSINDFIWDKDLPLER